VRTEPHKNQWTRQTSARRKALDANGILQREGADGLRQALDANRVVYLARERHQKEQGGAAQGDDASAAAGEQRDRTKQSRAANWPEPKPLPDDPAPVAAFEIEFLPESIGPWIDDIAERMQCAPEFVAIPVMTALGTLIGRKIGVRPQRHTDWHEVPNVWGCTVGRPGILKSPAMEDGLRPLRRLETAAHKVFELAQQLHNRQMQIYEIERSVAVSEIKAKKKAGEQAPELSLAKPVEPKAHRYFTNDSSYEKLGELLAGNPNGVLVVRDELVSLLRHLDREEHAGARGFYLTGWSGMSPYTFDRIGRGTVRVEAVCIGVLGSATPGALAEYIRRATACGAGDDGLLQRFGLLVWPDQVGEWKNVDRGLDTEKRDAAWEVFGRLDTLLPTSTGVIDSFGGPSYLRFVETAAGLFDDWRANLERQVRSADVHPALASHLSKYRKLVPALALINQLSDGGTEAISKKALERALRFAVYLETHARRVYAAGPEAETAAAKAILQRIRRGDLADGFTARDIQRKDWSNLTDHGRVQAGLNLLVDLDWTRAVITITGGRPKTTYSINPRAGQ
jgi:hypothetical protein